jgi:hypothetical protein
MSGNVPPPPPPGPAPQDRDGDPSRPPARPAGSYQAPPSFAPGAPRATARSSTSAGSPSVPSAAERTMPHPVHQTTPQPAPSQHTSVQSPAGHQHAPIPPAPADAGAERAAAAQTQVHGQPPAPQVPHRQPSYSSPAPQYGYMSQPPAYQQQPAYQPPPAYQQPAPQAPAQRQAVQADPPTTQNPAVGARRRLSPGWIAFIVVDVVLIVVAGIFAFNALTGSAPQVPQGDETVAAAPSDGATDDATGAAAADPGEQLTEFASPSRNITCQIFENAVTCGIAALEQQPAPVESCNGTTGYVVTLDAEGMVSLPCVESGDTPKKAPKKMDQVGYGESVTEGDFTCESREDGMHCQHDPTGNGFSLARAGIGSSE